MNKKFDCVKMKHEIQKKLYKKINPSSIEEYFNELIKLAQNSKLLLQLRVSSKR